MQQDNITKACSICAVSQSIDSFYRNMNYEDGRDKRCKSCMRSYMKNRWLTNSQARITAREKARARVLANFHRMTDVLASSFCVDCGEKDPLVLDFDHVRGRKRMAVSKMVSKTYKWETIEKEIAKCEVRCTKCHRKRTSVQQRWSRATNETGTCSSFPDEKERFDSDCSAFEAFTWIG